MILGLLILAVLAGIFCHYAARWKQGRTNSSFKEYMLGEWVGTLQSCLSSISVVTGVYLATPDLSGNLLIAAMYSAFTTGYTLDSMTNTDPNPTLPGILKIQRATAPSERTKVDINAEIKDEKRLKDINDKLSSGDL